MLENKLSCNPECSQDQDLETISRNTKSAVKPPSSSHIRDSASKKRHVTYLGQYTNATCGGCFNG